jgi:hypothetical protein
MSAQKMGLNELNLLAIATPTKSGAAVALREGTLITDINCLRFNA